MNREALLRLSQSSTNRLAATYLAIIMAMSIGFSIVFYNASANQLGRQLPPPTTYGTYFDERGPRNQIEAFLYDRINEGRRDLLARLLVLNLVALGVGSVVSYYLARRSLEPIEESMEAQQQFIGDAAHELKTPLTAMKTANEVALRKPKLTLAQAKQVIEQNSQDIGKLAALSDALLQLANHREPLELSTVSLQAVTADALSQVVSLAQSKKITVDDQVGALQARAYGPALTQVLTILLDNAIKYSPAKSTIRIRSETKGKLVWLRVQDQGPGIKPADQAHIFNRFYRADPSRAKQQADGYGLGLSIAQKLMEQQHGQISVQSQAGKGATFSLKLPAN